MTSGELHVMPTEISPEFLLKPEGLIRISGRSLRNNHVESYERIADWVEEYINDPAEITKVIIALEYLNDTSSQTLVSILNKLKSVILKDKKINILWYHEQDDEDMIERGEFISQIINLPVNFLVTANIKMLNHT